MGGANNLIPNKQLFVMCKYDVCVSYSLFQLLRVILKKYIIPCHKPMNTSKVIRGSQNYFKCPAIPNFYPPFLEFEQQTY